VNPQIAGLQVALRAWGLYAGPIDGISGPLTAAGLHTFQQRHHLDVGVASARTRVALGPLGHPLFGSRPLVKGDFGWDVSVLQFVLTRDGLYRGALTGYLDASTQQALRKYQRHSRLEVDGVAGPITLTSLATRAHVPVRAAQPPSPQRVDVRSLLDAWAAREGVDQSLVRALAWMESGYNTTLVSKAGARGVLQLLPSTRAYVSTVLLGRSVPRTVDGDVEAGVVLLKHLLGVFNGDANLALAAWYQGERAVRTRGVYAVTRPFVADVLALRARV
jgi:peptidoglycan hydrolase-like protein with peptidoglycan-binding domain